LLSDEGGTKGRGERSGGGRGRRRQGGMGGMGREQENHARLDRHERIHRLPVISSAVPITSSAPSPVSIEGARRRGNAPAVSATSLCMLSALSAVESRWPDMSSGRKRGVSARSRREGQGREKRRRRVRGGISPSSSRRPRTAPFRLLHKEQDTHHQSAP
jgi:hypothetical protein